ncbi:MAG: hypothetical protein EHM81_07010 [Chloroflexi bacterium]|nr:MAG: hypothetical protein EHM81_07010 [Chloroflexota bacterium]
MTTPLFIPAFVEEISVEPDRVLASIQAYQKDLQTGLVEVSLPAKSYCDLLFVRGQVVNAYKRGNKTERIPPPDHFPTPGGAATLRAISLTPQAIRLAKILLEQVGAVQPVETRTDTLESQIDKWRALPFPGLVQVRWPGAEALALLTGSGRPPRHTIFIAANQILQSPGGMMALYGWKERDCSVTYYSSESQTLAWQEYLLHYSFIWMAGHLLLRVEELTGRLLLNSVLRETNFSAAAHGLIISFAPGNVTDQTIFTSPEESAQAYKRLMEQILTHVESIIGADSLKSLVQESTMRMQPSYRRVFQENFNFSRPGPSRAPDLSERTRPASSPQRL